MNSILRLSLDSVRRRWWLYLLTALVSLSWDQTVREALGSYPIVLGAWLLVYDYARHTWRAYDSVPARRTDVTKAIWCQGAVLLPLLYVAVGLVSYLCMVADYPVDFRETLPEVCVYVVPAFGILILLFFEPESPASTLLGHLRGLAFLVVIVAALVAAPSLVLAWHIRHKVISTAPFTLIGVFIPTGLMCIARVKEGHCGSSYSALQRWYLTGPRPKWVTETAWGRRLIVCLACCICINLLVVIAVDVRRYLGIATIVEEWYRPIGGAGIFIFPLILLGLLPRPDRALPSVMRPRRASPPAPAIRTWLADFLLGCAEIFIFPLILLGLLPRPDRALPSVMHPRRASPPAPAIQTWVFEFLLAFGVTLVCVLLLRFVEGSFATPGTHWNLPPWAFALAVPIVSLLRYSVWVTSLRALRPLPLSAARLTLLLVSFLAVHLTGIVLAVSLYLVVTHRSSAIPSAACACAIVAAGMCAIIPSFATWQGKLLLIGAALFGSMFFSAAVEANSSLADVSTLTWVIIWLALMSVGIIGIYWTIAGSSAAYKQKPFGFDPQARRL